MNLPFFTKRKRLTDTQQWALAAGGVLTENNRDPFDRIELSYGRTASRVSLKDWWDAGDRESLLARLTWLRDEGHRTPLMEDLTSVSEMLEELKSGDSVDLSKQGEFIVNNLHVLRRTRFLAWDYSRMINVARWGFVAEYISEAEAWQWISHAAWTLRCNLSGWKDVGDDFVLGYRFWSIDKVVIPSVIEAYDRLLNGQNSPWKRLSWGIDPSQFGVKE